MNFLPYMYLQPYPLSYVAGSNDGSQFDNGVGPMRAHVFSSGIEHGGSLSAPSTLVLGGVIGSNLPFHVGFCEGEWRGQLRENMLHRSRQDG